MRKAYLINFKRQSCIEEVIDDGRPYYKRLRKLGVLFDTRQDAKDWLLYRAGVGSEVKEPGYCDKDVILEALLNARRYIQISNKDGILIDINRAIRDITSRRCK